jgi:hypothetical protein
MDLGVARPWKGRIDKPVLYVVPSLHGQSHTNVAGWHLCDAIGVLMGVLARTQKAVHVHTIDTLSD